MLDSHVRAKGGGKGFRPIKMDVSKMFPLDPLNFSHHVANPSPAVPILASAWESSRSVDGSKGVALSLLFGQSAS